MPIPKNQELFDLTHTQFTPLLAEKSYPWEALPHISSFLVALFDALPNTLYEKVGDGIYIAKSARVAKTALVEGPTVIGENAEIRHGAYIRGSALIGADAVVGNSSEIKNAVLFDGVQVPHYNYVGDSILGYRAHMGAGAIASNMRADRQNVVIRADDETHETGLRKVGAFLGDYAEIGCGAVLCPGTVVGRQSTVYPLVRVRGYVPENAICKSENQIVIKANKKP